MNAKKALLAMIKSEIGEKNEPFSIEPNEYEKLFVLAKMHDIAGIAASALSKAGKLADDAISQKLSRELFLAVYRREQLDYVIGEIGSVFEKERIPHVPLKGAVLCKYYPQDFLRSSCDVDILIVKDDAPRAIDALRGRGYKVHKTSSEYEYSLFSPAGMHVELHFTLEIAECSEKTNAVLRSVWDETVADGDREYAKRMLPEAFIFYHVAHMAKHFLCGGCGMRPFIDLWVIDRKLPYDKEKLEDRLSRAGLIDFYLAARALAFAWFENAPKDRVAEAMEDFVLSGGVYGSEANAALIKAAKKEGRARSFFSLAFMPRAKLEIIYPRLERYPALAPFYQVKRWFRVFNGKKRKKIKRLMALRGSVSRAQEESAAELILRLGLLG